jgi:hypothetical protein
MEGSFGPHHAGAEKQESAQAKAERILPEELGRGKLGIEDLEKRKRADPVKVKIALRLRQETTMTWDWIAQRLAMGAGAYAANSVRAIRNGK